MKEKWRSMSKTDRSIHVLVSLLSATVIVLAVLQLLGIWKDSINVYEPLLGVILLLQARQFWKINRKIAVFQLCAAVVVFICAFVILILPLIR